MENKLMRCLLTLSVTVLIAVLLLGLLPVHGESEIYDSVVRLHVLANSDSAEDQELKFKVRDYVLMETSKIVDGAETREEAEAVLRENLDRIKAVAAEVCEVCFDHGYDVNSVKNQIKDEVSKLLYQKTKRRPMVLPLIMCV